MSMSSNQHLTVMDLVESLEQCSLFQGLPRAALLELAGELEWVELKGRQTLFRQGEPGDCLYIVCRGRLRALNSGPDGSETVLGDLVRGEYLGEVALLVEQTRTATIQAVRDSLLIKLERDSFQQLLVNHPHIALPLAREIFRRSQTHQTRASSTSQQFQTLALIPATPGVPLELFAQQLEQTLTGLGRTIRLTPATAARHLGSEAADRLKADQSFGPVGRLEQLEDDFNFVIYQAGPDASAWTRLCLRQADLVLIVGELNDPTGASVFERLDQLSGASGPAPFRYLALLRPPGAAIRGTAAWLARPAFQAHYHLELGNSADLARLVRLLAGRGIGLAFSGGGGRSVAFAGVLRAFQERRLPVDLLAATSGGAIVAGLHAIGLDWQEVAVRLRYLAGRHITRLDFNPPFTSLLRGHKFNHALRQIYGTVQLEDLPLTFLPCCTSLTTNQVIVPQSGPLWQAVRASATIPGIWPPVPYKNHWLVDGGVLNNLPADLLADRCRKGRIVACDVTLYNNFSSIPLEAMSLSGWRRLWLKLNPFTPTVRTPGLYDIVSTAATLSSLRHSQRLIREEVDLYIAPNVSWHRTLDLAPDQVCDRLINTGYRQAIRQLEADQGEWPSLQS